MMAIMSITVTYYRLPVTERESVTRDQTSWEPFRKRIQDAYFQSFHKALDAMEPCTGGPEEKKVWSARLVALLKENRDPRRFDMEKDWHIIGYLLTGHAEIVEEHREDDLLHSVIFGGHETAATTGYGAVRYYDAPLVARSADALQGADRDLVAQRFNPSRMTELKIYAPPEENERDVFLRITDNFAAFFREAAAAKDDVIKFAS